MRKSRKLVARDPTDLDAIYENVKRDALARDSARSIDRVEALALQAFYAGFTVLDVLSLPNGDGSAFAVSKEFNSGDWSNLVWFLREKLVWPK